MPLVKLGLPVEVSVQSLPGEVFHGEISFIDHMIKPGTRTISIRADAENKDHRLKIGMFARVRLRRDWPAVLAVPENAVLWSGHRSVVMVRMGEARFSRAKWNWVASGYSPRTMATPQVRRSDLATAGCAITKYSPV